jgi:hypothetical protein
VDLELPRVIVREIKNNREEAKVKYRKTRDRHKRSNSRAIILSHYLNKLNN